MMGPSFMNLRLVSSAHLHHFFPLQETTMKIDPQVESKFSRLAENVQMWNTHNDNTWDASISQNLTIVEARPNFLVFEFEVAENHTNGYAFAR